MDTPTTPEGLTRFDHLPWEEAVRLAWQEAGANPGHHHRAQGEVERAMPLLARALRRAAAERPSFTCPACWAVSHHPEDARQGYCGRCHDFTGRSRLRAVPWQTGEGQS